MAAEQKGRREGQARWAGWARAKTGVQPAQAPAGWAAGSGWARPAGLHSAFPSGLEVCSTGSPHAPAVARRRSRAQQASEKGRTRGGPGRTARPFMCRGTATELPEQRQKPCRPCSLPLPSLPSSCRCTPLPSRRFASPSSHLLIGYQSYLLQAQHSPPGCSAGCCRSGLWRRRPSRGRG